MSKYLQVELTRLKKRFYEYCAVVEEDVRNAVRSVYENDKELAMQVIDKDNEIDKMEIEIEEECLKLLALYQPVAIDLRLIISMLKINSDLERIGDLAVSIAERSLRINELDQKHPQFDFTIMCEKSLLMVKNSIDSLIDFDEQKAKAVMEADEEIDALHKNVFQTVGDALKDKPNSFELLSQYLTISRALERIGDHATNIAEDVVYMINGTIVRHQG
ncbi:TPA: phosphate transport system regulatory protein PhoU [Candidatus Delongbacteria bacterium]|nr:phosphate transport system regulatory protein PhoU [Candidatus Delongbacteria bacterium]